MLYGSLVEAAGLILNKLAEVFLEDKIQTRQVLQFAIALVAGIVTVIGNYLHFFFVV